MKKTLSSFSYSMTGGILMLLYTFLLLQFGCLLLALEKGQKKISLYSSFALIITSISLVFMRVFNERAEFGFTPSMVHRLIWLERLPWWGVFAYLVVLGMITIWLVGKVIKYARETLTRSAIKESFDNLPTGLVFSTEEGFVLLANRKMEQLCFELTGQNLQDARKFWKQITRTAVSADVRQITYGDQLCFRLKNQEIWTFQQEFVDTGKRKVSQITAVNISELYKLYQKLEENHSGLEQMNQRLKKYSENMDSYVRSRELLDTKIRIHKEMGQALLASRAFLLQDPPPVTDSDIKKRWESVILLLKKEAEPELAEDKWNQFVNEAREAGVQVLTKGELPNAPQQREYLLMAAVEALTNAVRHAGADQLYITITDRTVTFSNNGKSPTGEITEGGGLGALRVRLEEAGGSMEIKWEPKFCLSVKLPPQGGEYDTYTGFDRGR